MRRLVSWALVFLVGGCAVHDVQRGPALPLRSRWALLPVENYAEAPEAGERAQALLETLLRVRGVLELAATPPGDAAHALPDLDEKSRTARSVAWARAQGYTYGVTGSVEEWRYRGGLDGEPAVGLSVRIIDLASGRVVWSASGARSGWARQTVSGTAQTLLKDLLAELVVK